MPIQLRYALRSISPGMLLAFVVLASTYALADGAPSPVGEASISAFRDSAFGGLMAGGLTAATVWARLGKVWGRIEARQDEHERRLNEHHAEIHDLQRRGGP